MAVNCSKCNTHLRLGIRKKGLSWDYCDKCQEEIDKKYTITIYPSLPPIDWNKEIYCKICKKRVPKKEKTESSLRYGWGLCSKKCSKEMRKTYGNSIPNRMGKYQVKEHKKDNKSKKEILASSFGVHF